MVTKKRRATPKVAEAAPSYKARSSKTPTGSLGEALWKFFQTLPEEEQSVFARKLLADPEWYEDIYDSISIIQSNGEPTRPFEEYVAEVERERAK